MQDKLKTLSSKVETFSEASGHATETGEKPILKAVAPTLFSGWWVTIAAMICISTGLAPLMFASFGIFVGPLSSEFGWSRGELSTSITFLAVGSMVATPIIGALVDRFSPKSIITVSLIGTSAGLISIPFLVTELWQLSLTFGLIGLLCTGTSVVPYMAIIANWFFERRGLALGIAASGIGLGYAVVPLLTNFIIENAGWREAYLGMAVLVMFVSLPLAILVLRDKPADIGLNVDGAEIPNEQITSATLNGLVLPQILRTRAFWVMSLIFLLLSFVLHGVLTHLVPALVDRGLSGSTAAFAASAMGVTIFVSRILVGILVDRYFAPYVAALFFSFSMMGMLLLLMGSSPALFFLSAILIGLSLGAEVDLIGYLTSRYFGLKAFGKVYGILFMVVLLGTAFGPLLFGAAYEATGSYDFILGIAALLCAFCTVLAFLLPQFPAFAKTDHEDLKIK